MKHNVHRLLYTGIILILLLTNTTAQINIQANAESGFYRSAGDFLVDQNDMMLALEGKLGYRYKKDATEFYADIKIRPELYSLKRELSTFVFRASGDFVRHEEDFDWGLNVKRQVNNITGTDLKLSYDIFSLQGNAQVYWFDNFPISFLLGYAYQSINSDNYQNHDIIFFEGKTNSFLDSYLRAGYGFYLEKFTIQGDTISNFVKTKENIPGFRIGPELEIYYLKDFVINGQYRLLLHLSDKVNSPSFEHSIRLIAGKLMANGFSIFLLVDYCLRDIKRKDDNEQIEILYSPFNLENQISLKIGYDLSEQIELYFKGTYFHNDLVYKDYMFEGGNILFGIGYSN